jgi:DNA polymerase V
MCILKFGITNYFSINLLNNLVINQTFFMEVENFFGSSYHGNKRFAQHDIANANATRFGADDDFMERGIDLNEQLIRNKPATFFMRVSGNSMINVGIFDAI